MLDISNTTRHPTPRVPFVLIAEYILGKTFELSLCFIGDYKGRKLNKTYRDKTYNPNVLSFPLTKSSGEIFINPGVARKQCAKFDMNETQFIGFLFIHACLHLIGHAHGDTMEKKEQSIFNKFFINGTNHRMRNRHRD